MKHWIFDLDNTLVNSFPPYTQILIEVLGQYGVHLTDKDRSHIRHMVLPNFLAKFLGRMDRESAFQNVVNLSLSRQNEIKPFEGIIDLAAFLNERGCILSVFTARELITARGILVETGLDRFFTRLVSRDCVVKTKPFPDGIHSLLALSQTSIQESLMIGDHRTDMEAAKAAGVTAVGVCWDQEDSDLTAHCDHHFSKVSELHDWAKSVFSISHVTEVSASGK